MSPTPTTLVDLEHTANAASPPAPPSGAPPRARRRRRALILVAVMIAVAGGWGVWWFLRTDDDAAAEAAVTTFQQLVEVTEGTITSSVSAESTVVSAEAESLSFASSGTVTEVLVAVGDTVTAGDVLARLDSATLEADVADAEATIAEIEATLADQRTSLWEYREDNEDDDDTYDDGDLLEDQIQSSIARLAVAQDSLDDAQTALDGAVLTASIDGTVTAVDLTVGEQLGNGGAGGTTLTGSGTGSGGSAAVIGSSGSGGGGASSGGQIEIVSAGRFVVELGLDSTEIVDVAVGQEVTISEATSTSTTSTSGFPAFPGRFEGGGFPGGGQTAEVDEGDTDDEDDAASEPEVADDAATVIGTVTEVSDTADASSGVATYSVTVEFVDDSDQFFVGTTVVAEIVTESRATVLVPQQAVVTRDDLPTVVVALDGTTDGATEIREVATGETTGNQIEVTAGVSVGEQLIIEITLPGGGGAGPGGGTPPSGGAPTDGGPASETEEGGQ